MKSNVAIEKKSPLKRSRVLDVLRREIFEKPLTPGTRLPPRRELEGRFGVSGITVQWALERLVQDGLIETRGRQGTFVAPEAPHLNRYALAFPTPREWLGQSKFWEE